MPATSRRYPSPIGTRTPQQQEDIIRREYQKLYKKYLRLKSEHKQLKETCSGYASNLISLQSEKGASSRQCDQRVKELQTSFDNQLREQNIIRNQQRRDVDRDTLQLQAQLRAVLKERNDMERRLGQVTNGLRRVVQHTRTVEQQNRELRRVDDSRRQAVENIRERYGDIVRRLSSAENDMNVGNLGNAPGKGSDNADVRSLMNALQPLLNKIEKA